MKPGYKRKEAKQKFINFIKQLYNDWFGDLDIALKLFKLIILWLFILIWYDLASLIYYSPHIWDSPKLYYNETYYDMEFERYTYISYDLLKINLYCFGLLTFLKLFFFSFLVADLINKYVYIKKHFIYFSIFYFLTQLSKSIFPFKEKMMMSSFACF